MNENPSISVIVPVLNEEGSLDKFYVETSTELREYSDWEMIFVDDGSDDESFNIIRGIAEKDSHVTVIQFFKNFGKADALSEGFNQATGDVVITIDADLQDDPAEIPRLITKIQDGWDVVSGWKKDRKDPASKRIPSKLFNLVTRIFTGIKIHDFNCGLKAYRRKVVKAIDVYGGFIVIFLLWLGKKDFQLLKLK